MMMVWQAGDMAGRMTRVFSASIGECIGTAARIQPSGFIVNLFIDGGNFLTAKGWEKSLS